jgi:hypothetical protein
MVPAKDVEFLPDQSIMPKHSPLFNKLMELGF